MKLKNYITAPNFNDRHPPHTLYSPGMPWPEKARKIESRIYQTNLCTMWITGHVKVDYNIFSVYNPCMDSARTDAACACP